MGAPLGGRTLNGFGCGTFRQSGSVIGGCFGGRIGRTSPYWKPPIGTGDAAGALVSCATVTVVPPANADAATTDVPG